MMNVMRIAAMFGCLFLCACVGKQWHGFDQVQPADLAWPSEPETSRVAYVTSITSHEDLYDLGSGFGKVFRFLAGSPDSRLFRPFAVAMHPKGILISDPGRGIVHFYNWQERKYEAIGEKLEGGLPSPVGVTALPGGDILVSDSRLLTVERFNEEGDRLNPFFEFSNGRPAGIAFSAIRNELYVTDVLNHQVLVFDVLGRLINTIGERGGGEGQFNFPTHIAVGPKGNIAVTDAMNFRIQLLTPEGNYLESYGELGNAPGDFSKPKGVVIDREGIIIAVEGLYDTIQFYNRAGALLLSIGGPGNEPGQFWLAAGAAYDPLEDLLFIADGYNSRVQVFRLLNDDETGMEERTEQ